VVPFVFFLRVQFTDLPQHNMSVANPIVNYIEPLHNNHESPEWNINEIGDLEMWVQDSYGTEQQICTGTVQSVKYLKKKSVFPHPSHASVKDAKKSVKKKNHAQVLCFTASNINGKGEVEYFFKLRALRVDTNSTYHGIDGEWLEGLKGDAAFGSKLCFVFLFVGARVDRCRYRSRYRRRHRL
jgi:hypothetical protein